MLHRFLKTVALAGAATGLTACDAQEPAVPTNSTSVANSANMADGSAALVEAPLAKAATDPSVKWGGCPPPMPAGCELAVLHGDPAKPNADVFLRVPGGAQLPAHTHSSAERMVLTTGELNVKYQDHAEATLKPGSYAYGPAGLPHQATCASGVPCTLFIAFEGPVDLAPFEGIIR